jgi:hypothetical protein
MSSLVISRRDLACAVGHGLTLMESIQLGVTPFDVLGGCNPPPVNLAHIFAPGCSSWRSSSNHCPPFPAFVCASVQEQTDGCEAGVVDESTLVGSPGSSSSWPPPLSFKLPAPSPSRSFGITPLAHKHVREHSKHSSALPILLLTRRPGGGGVAKYSIKSAVSPSVRWSVGIFTL